MVVVVHQKFFDKIQAILCLKISKNIFICLLIQKQKITSISVKEKVVEKLKSFYCYVIIRCVFGIVELKSKVKSG